MKEAEFAVFLVSIGIGDNPLGNLTVATKLAIYG